MFAGHVSFHLFIECEKAFTFFALDGFLLCVDTIVSFDVARISVGVLALGVFTHELLTNMYNLMCREFCFTFEHPVAIKFLAFPHFFLAMFFHVPL